MKNRDLQLSNAKWSIRDFDLESCNILSKWLSRHIKLLQADLTNFNITLEDLGLSNRAYNVLKNNHIDTIHQLNKLSIDDNNIRTLRGAGSLVAEEILQKTYDFQNTYIFKEVS